MRVTKDFDRLLLVRKQTLISEIYSDSLNIEHKRENVWF